MNHTDEQRGSLHPFPDWITSWPAFAFDEAPIAMAIVSGQGQLIHVNSRFAAAVGTGTGNVANRPLESVVVPLDAQHLQEELTKVFLGRKQRGLLLVRMRSVDGSEFDARLAISRVREADDWWLVVSVDRCEDWESQSEVFDQQLEHQRQKWLEAEQARDTFLSIACHELKTPISAMQLQVQSILRTERARTEAAGDALTPVPGNKAVLLKKTLDKLTHLIDNLLDISRLRLGKLTLCQEDVELTEVVRDVAVRAADEIQRAGCSLTVTAHEPIHGFWDRLRLEQILTNLVQNACKYGRGGPIQIRVEQMGNCARVLVQDAGIGISAPDQARIFDPFQRAVTGTHYEGFGLGLWIVRQFLEAMGGAIRVQSQPGHGSTFIAELPLTTDPLQDLLPH